MKSLKYTRSLVMPEAEAGRSLLLPVVYYWLPPFLLTIGILLMAGDWGAMSNLRLPIRILTILFPASPLSEINEMYGELRKVMHFLVYAALFAVHVRAWRWHVGLRRWPAIGLALLICLLVSSADEGRQALYLSRTGSPRDILLDMSGAVTAAIALFPFLRRQA
ncbi:MAG: VanZ family protein [Desulfobacca sp.]|uniref:VanZ family protein n=1 Tax=Desulfobacca sp. TaxID=2067990 RepID=UPI00404B42B0